MRNWDGTMGTELVAPTLVTNIRAQVQELILTPKLGKELANAYRWPMSSVWFESVLSHQPAHWLPAGYANYDDLITAGVEAAVNQPDAPRALSSSRSRRSAARCPGARTTLAFTSMPFRRVRIMANAFFAYSAT